MARVRLLARQSLTRGDTTSVADQLAGMRAYFTDQGHTIIEPAFTAENTRGWRELADRADLTDALASADRREYDVLGVWSVDRLARSVRILETVVHELNQHGVTFASRQEPWASDPFMRQIAGAIAEKFTRDLSARLKLVWPSRHRQGKHHGIPPYGFGIVDGRLVVADDSEAVILRRIVETMLDGGSIRRLVTDLNTEGVLPRRADAWSEPVVRVILRNPALAGGVRLNGDVVWDAHPGIISRADWDRLQSRIGQAVQPRAHKLASSWLDGLVEHGCGARSYVLLYRPVGREVRMIACRTSHFLAAGRCDLRPRAASARKVEAAVRQALARDFEHRIPIEQAIAQAERLAGSDLTAKRRAKLLSDRARIGERRQRAERMHTEGYRDWDWWVAEESEAAAALVLIDDQLAALPQPPESKGYTAIGERMAGLAGIVDALPEDALRAVLRDAGIVVVDGTVVTIRYHHAWERFIPSPCRVPWRGGRC